VASQKRRGRGVVLIAVIAVLALLAAGTGWWFGLGPGSKVTIPETIRGMSPAQAEATLTGLGFDVDQTQGSIDSPTVPVGAVAETDPAIGEPVGKGEEVQLLISTGPKPIPFAIVAGMPLADAEAAIEAAPWTPTDPIVQFDATQPKDTIVDVLDADGASLLAAEATVYGQEQKLTLVVSAGPVPDVVGQTLEDAKTILSAADVSGSQGSEEYSDDIEAGMVIRIELAEGQVLKPGDSVLLTTSKGRAPVDVPNIVGWTWRDAKAKLDELGILYDYNQGADLAPNLVTVKSTDPGAGTTILRGDTIKVKFTD
jgi:serine/threonine-protein kinase